MSSVTRRHLLRAAALCSGASPLLVAAKRTAFAEEARTLTLYSGQHAQTTARLVDAFTKASGVKVTVRKGESPELANQIIEEGAVSPADVFYSEESAPVAALAKNGLLARIDPTTLKAIPAEFIGTAGVWIGVSARCRVVAYNKAMIQEGQLPASVMDFAGVAWKDKVAYVPTSGAFQEQIVAIEKLKGRDVAVAWLKGLKAYGRPYNGNMGALKGVENGEVAVALINNYYWFSLAAEKGVGNMKSALHYLGHKDAGALITVSAAAALKSSKKADLAQTFLAFMVSERGQQAIADSVAEYPLRPGVKSPFALKPWSQLDPPPVTPADLGDAADAHVLEQEAGLA